ncbi:MAG: GNAT family N-acetyltransferase [Zetaproteobacteria bacterium CG2_30_46_52]|nr:MAG: GNAT family N-acetyltransferase [Zetaproteobacteria bacterium CG2_30_46_52]
MNALTNKLLGNTVRIREAKHDDLFAMTALLTELFNIEVDFTPNLSNQREGLAALMSSEESTLLVADVKGKIIGMCTLQSLISTAEGGLVGIIEDLVIAQDHRGQGIGMKLLETIEKIAKDKGMLRLQLLTDVHEKTEAFFSQGQWKPTQLVVKRKLLK